MPQLPPRQRQRCATGTGTHRPGQLPRFTERNRQAMNRRALLFITVTGSLFAQVSFDRIVRADKEPHNWLTYSGGVQSQRHSTLTQITPDNVKNLELQWV